MSSNTSTYTVRHRAGFAIASLGSVMMMASASAPSPFYPALQREMGFSDFSLTLIFAVYALSLLITLLIGGASSDYLGRRPVLSSAFVLLALSAISFEEASVLHGLIAARALQGGACALLLSTLSAAITDLEPPQHPGLAAVCNSTIPMMGLGAGALVAGAVMQQTIDAKAEIFGATAAISLFLAFAVWLLPETSPRHDGLAQALRPRLGLPETARGAFWRSAPAIAAGWATGGLYLSLGAPIIAVGFGITNTLLQGGVVALLSGAGALACYVARVFPPRKVMLYGTSALAAGTLMTLVGIEIDSLPFYLLALIFAGTGFGTCFYASLRSIIPFSRPGERGELFASIFTLCYSAFGIPVVCAGMLIPHLGLHVTVLVYGLTISAMALLAFVLRKFSAQD